MNEPSSNCPDCGAALPAESPQSLCPACLMRQALASRTMADEGKREPVLPPPSPDEIADRFPGFEILECLGRGGMGVVYKARQKSLNRLVAIKILAPERGSEARFAERFAREAEFLARLNHPHIVTIHDFGETGGLFYLVMEFVDGVNLRDLLRDGKLEPKQALAIVPPICEALQYAHDKGIVHRDIKPENLLLDRDGRIKIADFGIASLVGAGTEASGTPPYMAPEQSGGSSGVDSRADIYALGVVFYEMLTGERPAREVVAPSRKVQLDVRIDEMVLRAMEKSPELRYQTAGEFRTVIETLQVSASPPPMPQAEAGRPPGMFRHHWHWFLIMIPLGVLLGLGAGAGYCHFAPKHYISEATVEVRWNPGEVAGVTFLPRNIGLMTSPLSLAEVAKRTEFDRLWDGELAEIQLRRMIDVQQIRGTDLLSVKVTDTDPRRASDIARAVAEVFQSKVDAIIHEMPSPATAPVSPNMKLVLVVSALGGLMVSPLLALGWMAFLERRSILKRSRGLKIVAVCLIGVAAAFLVKPRIFPATSATDGPVIGRIEFQFDHPDARTGGFGMAFDLHQREQTRWRPGNGQQVGLTDGRVGLGKCRAVSVPGGSPVAVVATSLDGTDWEIRETVFGTGAKQSLEFSNGFKVDVGWRQAPVAAPGFPRWIVVAGIALLGLFGGLIFALVMLSRARPGPGKVLGIVGVVLLMVAMAVSVPVSVLLLYMRTRNMESAAGVRRQIESRPIPGLEAE